MAKKRINKTALRVGMLIEERRVGSPCAASEIARDNLIKNPNYYDNMCSTSKDSACRLLAKTPRRKRKSR